MTDSKRIVKNTLFLYMRMILVMGVTLYTARIVLEQLGASDFGIYSLAGSIVAMLTFFRGAMASATRRYLSFDIGRGDFDKLRKTFSATLTIHIGIAVVVLILAETVGLWYVKNKMVFPQDRSYAVNIVYQFSIFTFLVNIIQVPYDALIQAHEKMRVYAMVSIVEVILKLVAVLMLIYYGGDKLIIHAILTFLVTITIRLIYQIYCRNKFKESKYSFEYNKHYFNELLAYSGWNLFGNIATMARSQGNNILLNMFFGTFVNAAYGLTLQVQSAVQLFVNNFQTAINPQIIKSYAQGKLQKNHELILQGSKFSFYLLFIIVCPVIFNTDYVLNLWLHTVPEYTSVFVQLALVHLLIDCLSAPLMIGAQATGKIKRYQIVVGTMLLMNLPINYLLLTKVGSPPYVVFLVMIAISFVTLFFRLFFLNSMIMLSVLRFCKKVLCPITAVTILCVLTVLIILPFFLDSTLLNPSFSRIILLFLICVFYVLIVGINKSERNFIKSLLAKKL